MLALALCLLCHVSPVQHAFDTSVVIVADHLGDDGKMVYGDTICTGFVITSEKAYEVIGTARHCTEDVSDRGVLFFDGDHGRVVGVDASQDADVAILYVRSMRSHPVVQFSSDNVQPGQRYFLVGMGSGDPWSYASLISRNGSEDYADDNGPQITFEAPSVWFGDSGSAVFDERGHVVGVLVAGMDQERPGVVFAAPISYIQDLL